MPAPLHSNASLDDDTAEAAQIAMLELAGTFLEGVPEPVALRLLRRSTVREIRAGEPVFPPADQARHIAILLMGTARSFLTAADGRQLTVRYARRGAMVGKFAAFVGAHPPISVQALTDCSVLELDVDSFATFVASEISVANALNLELIQRLEDVYATIGDSAFGSIRQRLIRHLLANAREIDDSPVYRIALTQQQLADAIGSSREVVARELGRLRGDGLLRTKAGVIELLNVDRLVTSLNSWQAESPY